MGPLATGGICGFPILAAGQDQSTLGGIGDLAHGITLPQFVAVDSLRKCLQHDCGDQGCPRQSFHRLLSCV